MAIYLITSPLRVLSLLSLSIICLCSNVNAASFDCKKAQAKNELIICNDPELSALDEKMAALYTKALSLSTHPEYLKFRQKNWIKNQRYLGRQPDYKESIKVSYREQIKYLDSISPDTKIYVNAENAKAHEFCYECGDSIIEITNTKKRFMVWGGASYHRALSEENNRSVYTNCDFDGSLSDQNLGIAKEQHGEIKFRIEEQKLIITDIKDEYFCPGFSNLRSMEFIIHPLPK